MAEWRESEWEHFRTRVRQVRAGDVWNGQMSAWRNLLDALRGGGQSTEPPSRSRPTSLFEAGATGGDDDRRPRLRPRLPDTPDDRKNRRSVYPEAPLAASPAVRRQTAEPPPARPRTSSRTALRVALRSPASLRTAILLREVLDPPVALRGDRR